MAGTVNELNAIEMLKEQLKSQIVERITETLVKEAMEDIETTLRSIIKQEAEKLTLTGIEGMRDFAKMRDELHVFINFDDPDAPEQRHHKMGRRNEDT